MADMVILSANPYAVPVAELEWLKVEQLLVQGAPYEAVSQSPVGQVLKGMFTK